MRSNIAPGGARPDYELPDHAPTIRKLSELQADDPLILTLARPPTARRTTSSIIYNGYWFWGRPSVDDLRRDLRELTREIRPDWDLSTPGLRDAWNVGGVSNFHGWEKWSPEDVAAERKRVVR
jgi:hypothetical protein